MRFMLVPYFWLLFIFLTVCHFLYLALLARPIFILLRRPKFDHHCHLAARSWSRMMILFMPGWKIEILGQENLPAPGEAVVACANHESASDIWAILCLPFQFRWLSKAEVFDIPAIGRPMHWAGYIPIKRGNKESHLDAMRRSSETLRSGVPMFFFPEGTRSKTGELNSFKIGAFKLSSEINVPILPVALSGTRDLLKKGSGVPGKALVQLRILEKTSCHEGESVEDYAARVRGIVIAALKNP